MDRKIILLKPYLQTIIQCRKEAFMSYKNHSICLKGSIVAVFLLIFQVLPAQQNFKKLDNWMANNINVLGGRAVLVIWKDGKIIYNHAENESSCRELGKE